MQIAQRLEQVGDYETEYAAQFILYAMLHDTTEHTQVRTRVCSSGLTKAAVSSSLATY
jgi:hypothetical protein